MNILVTGATGFIGREIVNELIENKHQVAGLGRSRISEENISPNFSFYRGDITDAESLSDLEELQNIEVIIHSAGLAHQFGNTSRKEFESVNIKGTENILKLGVKLKIKHFILIGSTAVYGIASQTGDPKQSAFNIKEDAPTNPQTLYAESKLNGEKICQRICEENKIDLTIFRLAPVIGEGNVGNIARLIRAIDKNRFIWIGNGNNLKSLIYKRDVARACAVLIGNKREGAEIFNLAAQPIQMKDFVNNISTGLNKKIIPIKIPASFLRNLFRLNDRYLKIKKIDKVSETVEKWLSDDVYSADKITKLYQFRPQTTIQEAICKQIQYYKTHSN